LAQRQSDAGTLAEFFGRVPDLTKIPLPPNKDFDAAAFAQGMRLQSLHAFCANLSFQGKATRLRFAVLAETSPGSLLELAGENKPAFATLPLAPAGSLSYNGWRVNLTAIYQTLRSAISAALSPKQRTTLDLGEAMIANQIEMKLPEALQLFTGEGASISASGDLEPASQLFAFTIQKPAEVLRLSRVVLSSFKPVEEHEGDTTFVKLSLRPVTAAEAPKKPSQFSIWR